MPGGHIAQWVRGSKHWQLKPGAVGLMLSDCQLFAFLSFALRTLLFCSLSLQMTLGLTVSKAGVVMCVQSTHLINRCGSVDNQLQHMANKVQRSLVCLRHVVCMCTPCHNDVECPNSEVFQEKFCRKLGGTWPGNKARF